MYAVVGCNACGALWLLSDPGETAQCPRCGKRHRTGKLRRLHESDDRETARQARAALLAERRGESEAFAATASVGDLEELVDAAGVSDREYLERSGLDADAVAAAGEPEDGGRSSRDDVVREALRAGAATEDAVVDYATERGVPAAVARDLLERLVRRGEATETRGEYRLL